MSKVTHIIFDMFNTLYKFDPEREETQINAAKQIELNISKAVIIKALSKADIWFAKETSKNSMHLMNEKEKDLFYSNYERILFNYAGYKITDRESSTLWDYVKNTKSTLKLFNDAENILNKLKNKNLTTGIVTNFDSDGKSLSKSLNLPNLIDYVITSKDAGASKPSKKIFEYSLKIMKINAEDCVFVGDQIDTDIIGAQNAKITPILIDRKNLSSDFKECTVINNLNELLEVINL
tara:strand:- start:530 stop:1237 length:708 start_codon:yes stop_codon:yes gene_type:complete